MKILNSLELGPNTEGTPLAPPLKFHAGLNMTIPESGSFEFDGTNLFFTDASLERQTVTGKVSQVDNQLQGPLEPATPDTVTAAATMDIGAATSNLILVEWVDGGDPVTSLGAGPVGAVRTLIFDGLVMFIQDPTKILLLDSFDMSTVAGTVATFRCVSAGLWQCLSWAHGFGAAVRGSPFQTIPDYINPNLSNMLIYGGAAQYNQPAALAFGNGSQVTYLQCRTPSGVRHVWVPDRDGDLFISPLNTEDPNPPQVLPSRAGRYLTAPYSALQAGAVVAGKMYCSALGLRSPAVVTELGFTVTTAAEEGATARIALYQVLAGALTLRVMSNTIPIDVTGDAVWTQNATIPAGVYLLAVWCDAACSINFDTSAGTGAAMSAMHGSASPTEAGGSTTQLTKTVAALPSTTPLSTLVYGAGLNPHLWVKL